MGKIPMNNIPWDKIPLGQYPWTISPVREQQKNSKKPFIFTIHSKILKSPHNKIFELHYYANYDYSSGINVSVAGII